MSAASGQIMGGSRANRLERHLPRWTERQVETDRRGRRRDDPPEISRPWRSSRTRGRNKQTPKRTPSTQRDQLAARSEPAESAAVTAWASDGRLECLHRHRIGWILTSASISFLPRGAGKGGESGGVCGGGRNQVIQLEELASRKGVRSHAKCKNSSARVTRSQGRCFPLRCLAGLAR